MAGSETKRGRRRAAATPVVNLSADAAGNEAPASATLPGLPEPIAPPPALRKVASSAARKPTPVAIPAEPVAEVAAPFVAVPVAPAIPPVVEQVTEAAAETVETAVDAAEPVVDAAVDAAEPVVDAAVDTAEPAMTAAADTVEQVADTTADLAETKADHVAEAVAVSTDAAADAATQITTAATSSGIPHAASAAPAQQEKTVMETVQTATETATNRGQAMFAEANDRAKGAMEKGAKFFQEMTEFSKGNVEAMVESSKIAARGFESMGQDAAAYLKTSFEEATQAMRTLATIKSPTELMKFQSDYLRQSFDALVGQTSRGTEATLKLAGEVAQPISNRVAVAAEKLKITA